MSSNSAAVVFEEPSSYQEEVRKKTLDWLDRTGNSVNILARRAEADAEEVGKFLHGDFGEATWKAQSRIRALLSSFDADEGLPDDRFVMTSGSQSIWEAIQCIHEGGLLGYVSSSAGTSKSETLLAYKRRFPDTLIVTIDITRRSVRALLSLISRVLSGESWESMANDRCLDKVIEDVRGWPAPILFDDAHYLGFSGVETIRRIWDATKVPMLLCAQPVFFDVMRARRQSYLFDQLVSRLRPKRMLSVKDLPRRDVELIAEKYLPGLDAKSISFLHNVAKKEGHFRTMVGVIKMAKRIADVEGCAIDQALLSEAYRYAEGRDGR
jgi:DNA transposition AAA+ family ATPase